MQRGQLIQYKPWYLHTLRDDMRMQYCAHNQPTATLTRADTLHGIHDTNRQHLDNINSQR